MGNAMQKLLAGLAGAILIAVVALMLISSLIAGASAFLAGIGAGSGCPGSASQTSTATPTACAPPSASAAAVVHLALDMAAHLHLNPACSGVPSWPNCYDTWYDGGFPQAVIAYGERACPGCWAWQNGHFQCVSFVLGAYSQVEPLPASGNAIDFWGLYRHRPGWLEIPANSAPAAQRGLPEPGDIIVWQHPLDGHVAIVTGVTAPTATANGTITFAQANAPTALDSMTLHPDLSVTTWPGYTVLGYIRPLSVLSNASERLVRISQLDPGQYNMTDEYTTWAFSACSAAAMTEVLNAYGGHYRIHDILTVEAERGDITPALGLVRPGGIADTVAQFGFQTSWGFQLSLDQVIGRANTGTPVIVGFPPDRYAGGHLLVVIGGTGSQVHLADSSAYNYTWIARGQFLAWWGGFSAVVTPRSSVAASSAAPASPYVALAAQDALAAGISPTLFVRQINVESGFNPQALSPAGAEGIAQLLPGTAAALGIDLWDPVAALRAAAGLMASYVHQYGGDEQEALAAYNAGSGSLQGALNRCGVRWLSCMSPETQRSIHLILEP